MSSIYLNEPPTEGKVCLETTVGEIDIELWSKECPKACRNFVQLCMEGYYDKTKFFRVVPDFIVQGGDPTNTGTGGESIWGKPFRDEFHSRLRMSRRGLVAMANAGKDDNGSQFFFTLAATKELQNKHTIFGKVVGNTLFNMVRLGQGVIDGDRPKYPHKITSTKVIINPFTDLEPRMKIEQERDKGPKQKASQMKATKNYKLLSFGEEAEDDEENIEQASKESRGKSKSAHDLAADASLAADVDDDVARKIEPDEEEEKEDKTKEIDDALEREVSSIRNKLKKKEKPTSKKADKEKDEDVEEDDTTDIWDDNRFEKDRQKRKQALVKEGKALKRELLGKKNEKKADRDDDKKAEESTAVEERLTEAEKNNDMLREYHQVQKKFKDSKKDKIPEDKSKREKETLAMLEKFKSKLSGIVTHDDDDDNTKKSAKDALETEAESGEEDGDIVGDDWMKTPLNFESEGVKLAKDANTKDDEWFDIFDPRNKINKRRREKDAIQGMDKQRKDKMMKL